MKLYLVYRHEYCHQPYEDNTLSFLGAYDDKEKAIKCIKKETKHYHYKHIIKFTDGTRKYEKYPLTIKWYINETELNGEL